MVTPTLGRASPSDVNVFGMANPLPPVPSSAPGVKPGRPQRPLTVWRLIQYVGGVAVLAGLIGYVFGWYRSYPAEQQRDRAMLRLRLSEARARALEGSVAVYRANWGDASDHLTEGVRLLDGFKAADQQLLSPDHSAKVDEAAALLRTAHQLAAQSNIDASGDAVRAAAVLGEVYRATPEP